MARDIGHRSAVVRGLVAALIGGVIGWIAAFSGLGLWGPVIGLLATIALILSLARRGRAHAPLRVMASFAFAFALLTWPLLWLLIGYIRYAISGQSLGD